MLHPLARGFTDDLAVTGLLSGGPTEPFAVQVGLEPTTVSLTGSRAAKIARLDKVFAASLTRDSNPTRRAYETRAIRCQR